jgi:predicted methyltransferase
MMTTFMQRRLTTLALITILFMGPACAQTSSVLTKEITPILAGSWRSDANKARDVYRHPQQTLEFFGVQPKQTVIEILPGGANAWYAEILAPLLNEHGQYIAANFDPDKSSDPKQAANQRRTIDAQSAKFAARPELFGKARGQSFELKAPVFGPANSADVVLTFRNVHNWIEAGRVKGMFEAAFAVLKPGGVFGVVDHRAPAGKALKEVYSSGYLPVDYVINEAQDAGFKLDKQSEINANPKDSKDHVKGVWTLPPVLANGQVDRDKYLAIGESDRFTLRFIKPAK